MSEVIVNKFFNPSTIVPMVPLPQGELAEGQEKVAWAITQGRLYRVLLKCVDDVVESVIFGIYLNDIEAVIVILIILCHPQLRCFLYFLYLVPVDKLKSFCKGGVFSRFDLDENHRIALFCYEVYLTETAVIAAGDYLIFIFAKVFRRFCFAEGTFKSW